MILLFFHKYRYELFRNDKSKSNLSCSDCSYRSIVMRRVFFLLGVLYMMRAFTMYATVMPVASRTYYCSPKSNHTGAAVITLRAIRILVGKLLLNFNSTHDSKCLTLFVWLRDISSLPKGMGLSINGQHVYCGDLIYSGHTVILCCRCLFKNIPRGNGGRYIGCLGVVFVMVAHGHYTVDVLIAYYVTTRVFWMYHTMACNTILKVGEMLKKFPKNKCL